MPIPSVEELIEIRWGEVHNHAGSGPIELPLATPFGNSLWQLPLATPIAIKREGKMVGGKEKEIKRTNKNNKPLLSFIHTHCCGKGKEIGKRKESRWVGEGRKVMLMPNFF